jgi:hydrogenase maturation protease
MKLLVVGCGNRDRGDDAAGLLVARRLRQMGYQAAELTGAATDLLELWRDAETVILVDAAVTGAAPGAIHFWRGPEAVLHSAAPRGSTHLVGVADALRLAAALGRLPRELIVYGIEGARFGIGEPPSPEVAAAVEVVCRRIARGLPAPGAAEPSAAEDPAGLH